MVRKKVYSPSWMTRMEWWYIPLAILVNLPLGYVIVRKRALTIPGGLLTAGLMGFLLFTIHPLFWVLLVIFFGSSTLLTRYHEQEEIKKTAMSLAEKGGQRDVLQVLANGGIPSILAIVAFIDQSSFPVSQLQTWSVLGLVIAFAVVNADTWATELGVTSQRVPRWILNPTRTVPRGTSGGISIKGLLASFLAAILIATVYSIFLVLNNQFDVKFFFVVVFGGLLGSLIDSFLGATVQAQYQCPTCKKVTEKQYHDSCNVKTIPYRGVSWFSNDMVNASAVLFSILLITLFLG